MRQSSKGVHQSRCSSMVLSALAERLAALPAGIGFLTGVPVITSKPNIWLQSGPFTTSFESHCYESFKLAT